MEVSTLTGEKRAELGTRASRKLRASGKLPAIIYGHGAAPESVALCLHDVITALGHGSHVLKVKVGSETEQYLIKEVQYDYLGQTPIHLDLARVDLDERVKVRVGIELRGVAKGISDGGILDHQMVDIEVECLVTEIPDTLRPMVTELGLNDSLLVKDLELPAGVTVLADPDGRVATVKVMHEAVEEDVEEAEEGAAESAQPEMIGRVRKDEDAAEEKK